MAHRRVPTEVNSLDATWSPDGTELAVADTPTGLWVIDGDGRPQLLAKGAFSSLSWGTRGQAAGRTIRSTLIAPALPSEAAAVTVAASVHTAMRSPRFASAELDDVPRLAPLDARVGGNGQHERTVEPAEHHVAGRGAERVHAHPQRLVRDVAITVADIASVNVEPGGT